MSWHHQARSLSSCLANFWKGGGEEGPEESRAQHCRASESRLGRAREAGASEPQAYAHMGASSPRKGCSSTTRRQSSVPLLSQGTCCAPPHPPEEA